MTQVQSSGARAPFSTPVAKGKAKAAAKPDKKIAVPDAAPRPPAAGAAATKAGTQVSIGTKALHALENAGEFVGKALLAGVEEVGEAAYYTARTIGHGVVDVAEGLGDALVDGVKGLGHGIAETSTAIGHGVVHVEHALGDVWGIATQGASAATTLATTLGNNAETLVTNVGDAATNVGVGAKAVLSGIGSVASTAANYGTFIVKQTGKALDELT